MNYWKNEMERNILKGCKRGLEYVLFYTHGINTNHPQADHFTSLFPGFLQFSKEGQIGVKKNVHEGRKRVS
jgi:hypothetical protein